MSSPQIVTPPPSRWRESARAALFEASFVVFGVMLALAANEWRENRAHRREAAVAVQDITTELRANRAAVASAHGYHGQLLSTLRRWPDSAGPPPLTAFPRGFIAPAQLSATAWEVASETGVVRHINYPIVLRVSQAYAQQRRYDDQSRNVGQVLYAEIYRGGPVAVAANYRNVSSLISAFWYRERQLLALYDSTLAKISTDTIQPTDSTRATPQ